MTENDELQTVMAEAVLGIEAENFLNGNIGKYILGCSQQDEDDAIVQLLDFKPYEYTTLGELQSALAKIQQNVITSRKVQGYLTDAIIIGKQAEEVIANIEE